MVSVFQEDVLEDIGAHLEGFKMSGGRVVVDVGVLPAVAEVTLVGKEAHQPSFEKEAIGPWRLVVVLMDLGKPFGEVETLVEYGMRGRELHEVGLGHDTFHLRHNIVLQAVVVVDMEEAAGEEVVAEIGRFGGREDDIAVAGEVDKRIVEEIGATDIDGGVLRIEVHGELAVAESEKVGQGSRVGVPVAAATVFEESDGSLGGGRKRSGEQNQEQAMT